MDPQDRRKGLKTGMIKAKQIERPKLVLIVDDLEINREVLGFVLEDYYNVIYAENGREALDLMYQYAEELSIMLLDLNMPVMNGYEVVEHMREDDRISHIPFIVLTADKDAELRALQMGAADFIAKPFDLPDVILKRVDRILELSEGKRLISAAEHDQLTGLYTRNFFFEYARRLYQYHPEMHMDAVVVNVEQFHIINAVNGREFGDEVLRLIGNEISAFLTQTEGIASREEADRFNIYCISQPDYMEVLGRLQEKVNRISSKVRIHLRMGVMPWREAIEPVQMFDRARAASSMVRGDYQNPLMICDDETHEKELFNQRLLNDLNIAVLEGQLQVYYQPKYDISCDPPRLCSAEALIRWNHPEQGMISPGQFIPLLEGNGLVNIVDRFVWKEAARQVRVWQEKYGFQLPVSVNLSRADVFDPNLVDRLVRLIGDNSLNFEDIKLEVTESAYTDKGKELLDVVNKLRILGYEIEMDDFGSGYSSLNMLSDMPIDVLKMDMKFIRNIETNSTDMRLVRLILDIAKSLGLKVVAEGVETAGQLNLLREAGCDIVQGYYFSRPVPAEDFEKLIEKEMSIERG